MIAFVKEGVELATNVLVAIYVFWKSELLFFLFSGEFLRGWSDVSFPV